MNNIFDKQRRSIYYDLKQIGLEEQECWAEANLILEHVTSLKRTQQITSNLNHFKSDWLHEITRILNSRRERKPLAYCLGEVEFAGLMFRIVPGVLIPRVDTETLVEVVVNHLCRGGRESARIETTPAERTLGTRRTRAHLPAPLHAPSEHYPIHIADIGVGCGTIAIALLKRLPNCTVWACDISDSAIHCALGNARRHNVHDRLTLVHGDWKKVLPDDFDIIVSNPPYLPLSAQINLQPEIAFEPKSALFDGSEDGLDFYKQFAEKLPGHFIGAGSDCSSVGTAIHTRPCSPFASFEIGDKQEQSVLEIFKQTGWQNVQIEYDANNLARVLFASPPPER